LAGDLAEFLRGQEQQAVLLEELARAERLHRQEILVIALKLLLKRGSRRAGLFRRWRLDHRKDRAVAVERLVEFLIALAPVQIGRNQRVNVGVDREMAARVVAGRGCQHEPKKQSQSGKTGTRSDDLNDYACQHAFSF